MNKITRSAVAVLIASSGVLAVGQTANAASGESPQNVSCVLNIISPAVEAVPAKEAVYRTITIPAVTKIEVKFVHKNANHPNSPRWEDEGWNADSNPNSVGWVSTGETREVIVTEAVTRQELVSEAVEAVPEIPAVTEEECHATPVPDTVVVPPADDLESYPAPSSAPNTVNGTPPASTQPVPSASASAPTQDADTTPTALANTGATDGLILWAVVGLLALAGGIFSVVRVRRNA